MKTLDRLLERIAREPLKDFNSVSEDLFFLELERFKKTDTQKYIDYVFRYNDIQNSKRRNSKVM